MSIKGKEDFVALNLKKHYADIVLALDRRLMQWRITPIVPGVRVCPSPTTLMMSMTMMMAMTMAMTMAILLPIAMMITHRSKRETTSAWPKEQALCKGIKPPDGKLLTTHVTPYDPIQGEF